MEFKKIILILMLSACTIGMIGCTKENKDSQSQTKPEYSTQSESQTQSENKNSVDSKNTTEKGTNGENSNAKPSKTPSEIKKDDSTTTKNKIYTYKKEGYYLYRISSDSNTKTKLKTEPIHDYVIVNNKLYYLSTDEGANGISLKALYKVDLATDVSTKLSDADSAKFCVVDDDIYFSKNFIIYTIKTNGTGLTKISSENEKDAILESASKEFVGYICTDSKRNKRVRVISPTKYNTHGVGAVEDIE
ncbi:hypothetical protein CPJCM30710_03070 [Clostridium polyendosporum]|uniref:Prolow-density lipoprotein receptor-related protein 1-like beta-propeller domain-containing protein n=1 Tax=Clostridium polyendosporum TaxID=69208 RepID=A0A919RXM6_9CLOT|nr:DUF5050 domain-containing protein [Clostridium polyendosporum]GIM27641.1 hypothetical protein CPJCM30710_03070 [Clostridium polyendosporum]